MAQAGTGPSPQENPQLTALDQQIASHQRADQNRSWVGYVASQFWTGDRTSLKGLEKLSLDAHAAQQHGNTALLASLDQQAQERIDADKKAVGTQDDIGMYTASGLKMATLFLGAGRFALSGAGLIGMESAGTVGWLGLAGTVGVSAADRARVGDSGTQLGMDLLLGASQGLVTKALFNGVITAGITNPLSTASLGETVAGLGGAEMRTDALTSLASRTLANPTAKGVLLSTASRGIDLAYNDSTYRDAKGNYSATAAAANLLGGTFDPRAIAIDTVMFGTVNSFARVVTGGQAVRPLYHTMLTSGTLGLTGGAYGEISKEWHSGQPLDWGEIGRRALIQGGVYTLSGIPGGVAADPAFRSSPVQSVKNDVVSGANNLSTAMSETAGAMVAAIVPTDGLGLQPAYAVAGARPNPGQAPRAVQIDTTLGAGSEIPPILMMDGHSGEGGHGASIGHDHGTGHTAVTNLLVSGQTPAAHAERSTMPADNADTSMEQRPAKVVAQQRLPAGHPPERAPASTQVDLSQPEAAAPQAVLAATAGIQGDLFAAPLEAAAVAVPAAHLDAPLGTQFSLLGEGEMFGADGRLKPGAITGSPIKDLLPDQWTDIRREAESKLTPSELETERSNAENFVRQLSSDNPNYFETQMSYQLLSEHPEVDSRMADLYVESVRNRNMPLAAGVRRLLDGFYRPPNAMDREPLMRSVDAAAEVNHITDWLETDLLNKLPGALEGSAQHLQTLMQDAMKDGVNVSDALRQYARTTDNQHFAAIIDRALALGTPEGQTAEPTNYADLISEFGQVRRSLPLTHEQYQMLTDPTTQFGAADSPPATTGVWSALAAWPRAAGTEGLNQSVSGTGEAPAAQVTISPEIAQALSELSSADPTIRSARVLQLARLLDDPSSEQWFDTWKQSWLETANDAVRSVMNSPAVQALPQNTVRRCLSFQGSNLMQKVGTMRELTSSFTTSAPDAKPITLDVDSINRIVELAQNRDQVDAVLKTIRTGKAGAVNQEYRDWLVKQLKSADSLDELIGKMEPGKFGGERRGMPIKFLLDKGFPDSPETVQALMARADADPTFNLAALAAKLGYGKDTSALAKLVREQLSRNATNAELNPLYLSELSFLPKYFRNSPQASVLMRECARYADPQAVMDLLRAPDAPKEPAQAAGRGQQRPQISPDTQRLIQGYKDFLGELLPRAAANLGVTEANVTQVPAEQMQQISQAIMRQLEAVSKVLRARPSNNPEAEAKAEQAAQAAVQSIIPEGDPAYGRAVEFAISLVTATASMVPSEQPAPKFAPPRPPQNLDPPPPPSQNLDPPAPPPNPDPPGPPQNPDPPGPPPNPGPARESDGYTGNDKDTDPIIVLQPTDQEAGAETGAPQEAATPIIAALAAEESALSADDQALHDLDTSMELGGSSAVFRLIDALFERHPIDPSAYLSMLNDGLSPFGSHVPQDRGYATFSDATEGQLFAEHVSQHLADNLNDKDKVVYRLQSMPIAGVEHVLPVIDVTTENGRTASGTPVLDLNGQVIGLSPLLGVEAPVPGAPAEPPAPPPKPRAKPALPPVLPPSLPPSLPPAAPVDQAEFEAKMAQLREQWGARHGGRRDGE